MKINCIIFVILVYIALCHGTSLTSLDCASCNMVTLPLTKLGEKCYYVEARAKENWYYASFFCNFHGMHLTSILNDDENTALGDHIKTLGLRPDQRLWTSGIDSNEEGNWHWFSSGTRITYSQWRSGQPDNAGDHENCLEVALVGGKLAWNDLACWKELPFICEV